MNTDDVLADLAWGLIRDWRRRRDVDPAIRRAGQGGSLSDSPLDCDLPGNSLDLDRAFPARLLIVYRAESELLRRQ